MWKIGCSKATESRQSAPASRNVAAVRQVSPSVAKSPVFLATSTLPNRDDPDSYQGIASAMP
jgi:hypothetical protein